MQPLWHGSGGFSSACAHILTTGIEFSGLSNGRRDCDHRAWERGKGKSEFRFAFMIRDLAVDPDYLNRIAPTAMVFVPSISGRSHVEVGDTTWEDCETGANVLLHWQTMMFSKTGFSTTTRGQRG